MVACNCKSVNLVHEEPLTPAPHSSHIGQLQSWDGTGYGHEEPMREFFPYAQFGWQYDLISTPLCHSRNTDYMLHALRSRPEVVISDLGPTSTELPQAGILPSGNQSNDWDYDESWNSNYYSCEGTKHPPLAHPLDLFTPWSDLSRVHNGVDDPTSSSHKQPVKRVGPDGHLLKQAFGPHSIFPNEALARLLSQINISQWLWTDEMEPLIGDSAGKELLSTMSYLPGFPPLVSLLPKQSIYTLLLDSATRKCLICGSVKVSLERAVNCIRSHLDHRPFVCGGDSVGCLTCKWKSSPARFFSSSLLEDHINGQLKKFKCMHRKCDASIRRGGMRRHWKAKHKDEEFPAHLYPRYDSSKM